MYLLKPEMAEELRITQSKIYQNSPDSLNDCDYIATVGDICTLKVSEDIREPELCIVDMKTKRNIDLKTSQIEKITILPEGVFCITISQLARGRRQNS